MTAFAHESSADGGPLSSGDDKRKRRFSITRPLDLKGLFERPFPSSAEAENAVLGSVLIDPRALNDVVLLLPSPEYFHDPVNAAIYGELLVLYGEGRASDVVVLSDRLQSKGVLVEVGGIDRLLALASSVLVTAHAKYYAEVVRAKYQLRKLIEVAGNIAWKSFHEGGTLEQAAEVLDYAEEEIFRVAESSTKMEITPLAVLLQAEIDRIIAEEGRSVTGVATGFNDLNELTSGFQKGEMIIIAARPSMGKTALALNILEDVALVGGRSREPLPVAMFSLEMSKQQLVQRLVCSRSGVDGHRVRRNMVGKDDFQKILAACEQLSKAPIYIDDTPGLSITSLRAKCRRMVSQYGVKCVIVDYLQLMCAPHAAKENRQQEVSAISRGLKALARELEVPIICLAQLNRAAETREGNRPRMGDLRESGSIEQDADMIMLLHREDYYHVGDEAWLNENQDKVGVAELIIAKQRNGPTDTVKLTWDRAVTRF
ncbi:MAG: replicative DNA helicase, partial [Planctomycetes bacterium]|nr:replicative DNA helicase [Planctomycetota bacterium]